jgi:hypothetical protein
MPDPVNGPMVNEISICNQALTWLGQKPIISFADQNTTAEWMRNNYAFLRDAVMEERAWTFATVKNTSTVEDLTVFGNFYEHPKPLNWLWIYRVWHDVSARDPNRWIRDESWRIEGEFVVSSYSTIYMQGCERVTDTGKFSLMFVQALAARIAADACVPLTENRQLQVDLWGLYQDKLMAAAARDGQQGSNDVITQHKLTGIRQTGGYTTG